MKCKIIQEKLSPYIDRELSLEAMPRVTEHLRGCSHCKEEYELLLTVRTLISSKPRIKASEDFEEVLWQRIAAEKPSSVLAFFSNLSLFWDRFRFSPMLAAIPAFGILMVILLSKNDSSVLSVHTAIQSDQQTSALKNTDSTIFSQEILANQAKTVSNQNGASFTKVQIPQQNRLHYGSHVSGRMNAPMPWLDPLPYEPNMTASPQIPMRYYIEPLQKYPKKDNEGSFQKVNF